MRRPVLYVVGVLVILAAFAAPFLRVQFGGFDERVLPADTEARIVGEALIADFPGGGEDPIERRWSPARRRPRRSTFADRDRRPCPTSITAPQPAGQPGDASLITASYPATLPSGGA